MYMFFSNCPFQLCFLFFNTLDQFYKKIKKNSVFKYVYMKIEKKNLLRVFPIVHILQFAIIVFFFATYYEQFYAYELNIHV